MVQQYIDRETLRVIRHNLWKIAKAKEITLEDIEDRTGFSYSQVYRIMRGDNNMSVSGLMAVCRALEIQPAQLFDFKLDIPPHLPTRRNRK